MGRHELTTDGLKLTEYSAGGEKLRSIDSTEPNKRWQHVSRFTLFDDFT
jgi:hypothetical protein